MLIFFYSISGFFIPCLQKQRFSGGKKHSKKMTMAYTIKLSRKSQKLAAQECELCSPNLLSSCSCFQTLKQAWNFQRDLNPSRLPLIFFGLLSSHLNICPPYDLSTALIHFTIFLIVLVLLKDLHLCLIALNCTLICFSDLRPIPWSTDLLP